MLSGGLDLIMNVAADQAQQLRTVPSLQVVSGETMRYVFLQLNTTEQHARAATARHPRAQGDHACDRPRTPWSSRSSAKARACCTRVCFPSQFGCTDEGAPRYAYDPAKAKQLLAEAGFPNGFEIDLYAYRERDQTEAMIGYLRAVGIRANLRFMQYAAMRDAVRAGKAPMAHQTWGSFSVNDVSAAVSVYPQVRRLTTSTATRRCATCSSAATSPSTRRCARQAYAKALALIQERAYAAAALFAPDRTTSPPRTWCSRPIPDEMPRFWEMSWK